MGMVTELCLSLVVLSFSLFVRISFAFTSRDHFVLQNLIHWIFLKVLTQSVRHKIFSWEEW